MELFPLFFEFTAEAHFNCTRLHLFRIIDDTKGANSIKALVEFAEKHPEFFSSEIRFKDVIQRHKKLLKEAKPKIDILLKQRHKHFIHKSNEYLISGYDNLYKEYKSSYLDYFELLELIGRMLNEYLENLKGESYFFSVMDEQQEFDALINSLNKGTEIIEKTNLSDQTEKQMKLSEEQIQQNSKNLKKSLILLGSLDKDLLQELKELAPIYKNLKQKAIQKDKEMKQSQKSKNVGIQNMITKEQAIEIAKNIIPDIEERIYKVSLEKPEGVAMYGGVPDGCWYIIYSYQPKKSGDLTNLSRAIFINKNSGEIVYNDVLNDEG
ncbi:MAG: hypothetical protein IPH11_04815 [Ignavibacteriales bacterium]|nr:hypothetical protein [Ignavibacteriales bacterium]